ncbi:Ubiquitin carboxyl-terminal hydrolase 24, partial [Stegodyphus mimosarum]
MAALLSPLAKCAEFLNPIKVHPYLSTCMDTAVKYIKCLSDNDIKSKVMKLIDDSSSIRCSKIAIDSESLLNWLAENEVLSIALEGNIDQVQYTDKIKGIVEFMGHRLSIEELTKIWNMQVGQNAQLIDNIHSIMTAAASKFSMDQFDHLLNLVQERWQESNDQMKKRLIIFIGRIGKETNQG